MSKWESRYWGESEDKTKRISPVEKWLDKLTNEQLKAVSKEIKMLEDAGNDLKLPHSYPLGNSLFELRERKYGYVARIRLLDL